MDGQQGSPGSNTMLTLVLVQAAVAGVGEAAARGEAAAVLELAIGLDPKACAEAWLAIQKAHPSMAALLLCPDAGACVMCS